MTIKTNSSFPIKFVNLLFASWGGVTSKDKENIQEIVSHEYESDRAFSNPPLIELEHEFFRILDGKIQLTSHIPWGQRTRFSKGLHLTHMVAFTDQHSQPVCLNLFPIEQSMQYIDKVIKYSDKLNRQITLTEQLSIALEMAEHNLLGASIITHSGSRIIAKNSDTRISRMFDIPYPLIKKWRDCVSNFSALTGNYGSPPADTYHFWGAFVYGLVSEIKITPKDIFIDPVYRFLYTHIAEITDILRYKIRRIGGGTTHKEADLLGFHIGSLVKQMLDEQLLHDNLIQSGY